jgi:hypothetical protein
MPNKNETEKKEKQIRLVWGSVDELPTLFVNQVQISHAGGSEFHIFFGHATPPLTFGLAEEEIPDKITIEPLAKIVVTPEMMRAVVHVLSENLENYDKSISERSKI